jgi:hypothetical protein
MDRVIRILLLVGLVLSTIGAIGFSVRIILGSVLPVRWYWGGAIGAYAGPFLFAATLYLDELRRRVTSPSRETTDA